MLVMRTPVTRVPSTPKSTAHHALLLRPVVKKVLLSPSLALGAVQIALYNELMNDGLPSAMFTSAVTAT